ncbi:MAG: SPOR domain-containing protein [Ectothiorhodospiraceae bacterium]|nr:SPOR domain-containing protein [Ectothiorhodospiraceae bacterium]MCH8504559.1 SPOR domain-containing protein [Ectothiorhodospiraceae bacterium]
MQQRHKQRLIGAIVVAALAIIFLPMVLRGPVENRTLSVPAEIPPRPDAQTASPGRPAADGRPPPALDRIPVPTIASDSDTDDVEPEAEAEPPAREAPAEPPATAAESRDEERPQEPASRSVVEGYAVQVGSFSRRDNAMALRDQLRDKGFPAFVDEAQREQGAIYRLRVGPVMNREEGRELAQRLQQEENLDGLVVSHP